MSRFVDYFVICGYDHTKGRSGNPKESYSQLVQRFPEKDWSDISFIHGLDLFCQPNGWTLSQEKQEPKFFVSILTDDKGNRLYCPCLTFSEAITKAKLGLQSVDEAEMKMGCWGNFYFLIIHRCSCTVHCIKRRLFNFYWVLNINFLHQLSTNAVFNQ